MGAKPKVTEKVFNQIKKEVKVPKDDAKAVKKYKLSKSTIATIRKSRNYLMYRNKISLYYPKKKKITLNSSISPQEQAQRAWTWFGIVSFIMIAVGGCLLVRWILSWFGI